VEICLGSELDVMHGSDRSEDEKIITMVSVMSIMICEKISYSKS
jgi:hypothetical protein